MSWVHANRKRLALTDDQYVEKFKTRTIISDRGCWLWQGGVNGWGYGEISIRGKRMTLHRFSHTVFKGPIPPGRALIVCHTCDTPRCWNPEHLWLGTEKQNSQDAASKKRWDRQHRTACPQGHPYSGDNLYRHAQGRKRSCKTCARIRQRIKAGWTREQAESMPITPSGKRPINRNRATG